MVTGNITGKKTFVARNSIGQFTFEIGEFRLTVLQYVMQLCTSNWFHEWFS